MTLKPRSYLYLLLLISTGLCIPDNLLAQGISIKEGSISKDDTSYYFNAKVDCDLSEESIEALHHGVALQILVDIKTQIKRKFLWDKTINHSTIAYKIEFHPLTERYLLTELNRYKRQDFQYLSKALEALGKINDWPLIALGELNSENDYIVLVKAKLDIEALPAPLRPMAFISKNWRMSSDWQQWELSQ